MLTRQSIAKLHEFVNVHSIFLDSRKRLLQACVCPEAPTRRSPFPECFPPPDIVTNLVRPSRSLFYGSRFRPIPARRPTAIFRGLPQPFQACGRRVTTKQNNPQNSLSLRQMAHYYELTCTKISLYRYNGTAIALFMTSVAYNIYIIDIKSSISIQESCKCVDSW